MSADDDLADLLRRARTETSEVEPPPDFAAKLVASLGNAVSMGNPVGVPQTPPGVSMGNPVGLPRTPPGVTPMFVELGAIGRFVVPLAAFAAAAAITLAWTAGGAGDAADAELDGVEAVP